MAALNVKVVFPEMDKRVPKASLSWGVERCLGRGVATNGTAGGSTRRDGGWSSGDMNGSDVGGWVGHPSLGNATALHCE